MYREHFSLSKRPFSKTPDPAFLYQGRAHAEALARLTMAAEEKDLALLTGEVGTGKTTLCRRLIDQLPENYRVVLIINPRLSAAQILSLIAERLGVGKLPRAKHKLVEAIGGRLFELYEQGAVPLVIVDEAHLIPSKAVFEELRLLTNLQLDDEQLIGLLLIGQPELRKKLNTAPYRSFVQRVGMAFHLEALNEEDTFAYVVHRLSVAGRQEILFSDGALNAVFQGSQGVPRRVNTICQSALLVAFGQGVDQINRNVIVDVLADLSRNLGTVFPAVTPVESLESVG